MKTDILASFPAMMANVREKEPIVQAITNFVTVNDCANIILAAGASPTMAHEVEEVAEVASAVQGLDEYGHHGGRGSHAGGRESR